MGRMSKYPPELREQAMPLVLVLDGNRSARDVARELGINQETLRNWVTKAGRDRAVRPVALSSD